MDGNKIRKSNIWDARHNTYVLIIVTVVFLHFAKCAASHDECKYMVRVGSKYRLQCSTNLTTAYNLVLHRYNYGIIPRREYHVIDNQTIEYIWENIPRISTDIECYFPDEHKINRGVSIKNVVAESEPDEVTSFKCVTYDFQYIRCSFHKSEQYFTHTKVMPSDDEQNPKRESFTFSQPKYDPENQNTYNFTVHSKNCFAERTQNFSYNHLENVIPGKPNVSLTNIKSNSATLRLTMTDKLYMKKGLQYEIKLLDVYFGTASLLNTNQLNPKKIQHLFLVENLHAFNSYTIEVKSKSIGTDDTMEMWSQPTIVGFQTLPRPPDYPPKVDVGSFHVDPDGCIYICWKMLPENEHNGDNFAYEISIVRRDDQVDQTNERKISRSFMINYYLPRANYEFSIRSVNSNGTSPEVLLKVPKNVLQPPKKLRSIYDGKVYQLSWEASDAQEILESFTVFRCVLEYPVQHNVKCNKNFTFLQVAPGVTGMNFTEENQFAVSANYANGSSGMIWIECTATVGSDIGVINYVFSTIINFSTIHLTWTLTCAQKTLLRGYIVKYCLDNGAVCTNKTFYSDEADVNLLDLISNSEYQIQIALFSADMTGPFSQVFRQRTLEAAPTPPTNLKVCNVTKDSITLEWNRPERLNGRLRYYRIVYDKFIELYDESFLSAEHVTYNLSNLKSYQIYNICVVAGTVSDSEASNTVHVRTSVDVPRKILSTHLETVDSVYINISWRQEIETKSPIKLYELRYESDIHNETKHVLLTNVSNHMTKDFNCSSNAKKYKFSIRAINVALQNKFIKCSHDNLISLSTSANKEFIQTYYKNISYFASLFERNLKTFSLGYDLEAKLVYGPWSIPVAYECKTYLPAYAVLLICLLSTAIGVATVSTVACYLRRKYNIAKNIGIVLPIGLKFDNCDIISVAENQDGTESDSVPESISLMKTEQFSSDSIDEGYRSDRPSSLTVNVFAQNQILVKDYNTENSSQLETNKVTIPDHVNATGYIQESTFKDSIIENHFQQDCVQKPSYLFPDIFDANGYVVNPSVFNPRKTLRTRPVEDIDSKRAKMFDFNGYVTMNSVTGKLLNGQRKPNGDDESRKDYKCYAKFKRYKGIGNSSFSCRTSKEFRRYSWRARNMQQIMIDTHGYMVNRPKSSIDLDTQSLPVTTDFRTEK